MQVRKQFGFWWVCIVTPWYIDVRYGRSLKEVMEG